MCFMLSLSVTIFDSGTYLLRYEMRLILFLQKISSVHCVASVALCIRSFVATKNFPFFFPCLTCVGSGSVSPIPFVWFSRVGNHGVLYHEWWTRIGAFVGLALPLVEYYVLLLHAYLSRGFESIHLYTRYPRLLPNRLRAVMLNFTWAVRK